MFDEIAAPPSVAANAAEPEFKIWRSLDGSRVLIRVGYTDLELTADAAGRLWRELAHIEGVGR